MTREQIETKSLSELKSIADKLNIKYHPRIGADKLVEKICQQPKAYVAAATDDADDLSDQPKQMYTKDQVLEAIKPMLAKQGFTAEFPDDQTWVFSCRGAQDSGHMSVPMRVIQMKAQTVSGGGRGIRVHVGEFSPGTASGSNAYTNSVLA